LRRVYSQLLIRRIELEVGEPTGKGRVLARCKVYEIQGPDPSRTSSAVRCLRDAAATITLELHSGVPVCDKHQSNGWSLFRGNDGWVYGVKLDAEPPTHSKKAP
jgi:hypothetical protein